MIYFDTESFVTTYTAERTKHNKAFIKIQCTVVNNVTVIFMPRVGVTGMVK